MKNPIKICILIFAILSFSCSKIQSEKSPIEKPETGKPPVERIQFDIIAVDTLTINSGYHSFINQDGKPFYDYTLNSTIDSNIFKLKMNKNVLYRISVTQPDTTVNQINLTLVNEDNDTMAITMCEFPTRTLIVLSPPDTGNYYLIVNHFQGPNPKLKYRLNFEEIIDQPISFSGYNWTYNGNWSINDVNEAVITNYNSNIFRHLKLSSTVSTNPNISFVIKSNSTVNPNFGIQIGGNNELSQSGLFAYELESSGYGVVTHNNSQSHILLHLNYDYISYYWTVLPNKLDFSSGIKVDLRYNFDEKSYRVYANNDLYSFLQGPIPLKNFTILVQDCGEGITIVKDLIITN